MGGDEVVAKWLGDVYAFRVTGASHARLHASTLRFRTVIAINNDQTQIPRVGKYDSVLATFVEYSIVLWPKTSIIFEYVDLYELGYYSTGGYLNITALNVY